MFSKNLSTIIIIILILAVGLLAGILIGKKGTSQPVVVDTNEQAQPQGLEQETPGPQEVAFMDNRGNELDTQPGAVHGQEDLSGGAQNDICIGEFCDGSGAGDGVERTVLQIPVVVNDNGPVGCGVSIRFLPHAVPQTVAVLNATYSKLFALGATTGVAGDPYHNYIADEAGLRFSHAEMQNDIASVYLEGAITASHCAVPAFREQIEQAAFQFDTVQSLLVYLNGDLYDWCAKDESNGEGGCNDTPQYWIIHK